MRRRWLAPEVIQTSAMDCGPAVLKAALEGFGVPVHLGRLREACQTEVDGTSLTTLAELARSLGMRPTQTLLPRDHLRRPEVLPLPAVVVLSQADRSTHFVLLWRAVRGWVQVVDPARGRYWTRWAALEPQLYEHLMPVPAEQWQRWAMSAGFAGGLGARLTELCGERAAEALFERHLSALHALDAATRGAEALRRARALPAGPRAVAFVEALVQRQPAPTPEQEAQWTGIPQPDGSWQVRGAVVLMLQAPRPDLDLGGARAELREALSTPTPAPLRGLLRGVLGPGEAALALAVAVLSAAGGVAQAALLRALLDAGRWLQTPAQRGGAVVALIALTALTVALGLAWSAAVARVGRGLETRVRVAFHRKLPRLSERYFSSRLLSDLAERGHAIAALRGIPEALNGALMVGGTLLGTLSGILWLDPRLWPLVLLSGLSAVALPAALYPYLASRELRRQTYDGALARSYLDAMLGAVPCRAHGAEESLRREHEALLVRWARAAQDALHASVLAGAVQGAAGIALAAGMVGAHLAHAEHAGGALLLIYWATGLPNQGGALAASLRALPALGSVAQRALEPLDAPEEGGDLHAPPPQPWSAGPLGLSLRGVEVRAGGRALLELPALDLLPGEHVAVVGRSGAGKSSLLGLVLGWRRPSAGELVVNGVLLEPARLPALRRRVAWVDPAVQLWNRSLLDNLRYGQEDSPLDLDRVLDEAALLDVLAQLPEGLGAPLGASGGLVSGGQGQRVRFGRALARPDVGLVLLDEPFRGLDRGQRRALLGRARARWAGTTLLCVSHDVGDTRVFPRVLVVEGGRVVEDGPPEVLLAQGGAYAAMLAEEDALRAAWSGPGWRHLVVERGTLREEAR